MRSFESEPDIGATEIDGHSCRSTTKMSFQPKFAKVAKVLWPKPTAVIASIAKCDIRTAQRMLEGRAEIPWCVLRAVIDEMLKPE